MCLWMALLPPQIQHWIIRSTSVTGNDATVRHINGILVGTETRLEPGKNRVVFVDGNWTATFSSRRRNPRRPATISRWCARPLARGRWSCSAPPSWRSMAWRRIGAIVLDGARFELGRIGGPSFTVGITDDARADQLCAHRSSASSSIAAHPRNPGRHAGADAQALLRSFSAWAGPAMRPMSTFRAQQCRASRCCTEGFFGRADARGEPAHRRGRARAAHARGLPGSVTGCPGKPRRRRNPHG